MDGPKGLLAAAKANAAVFKDILSYHGAQAVTRVTRGQQAAHPSHVSLRLAAETACPARRSARSFTLFLQPPSTPPLTPTKRPTTTPAPPRPHAPAAVKGVTPASAVPIGSALPTLLAGASITVERSKKGNLEVAHPRVRTGTRWAHPCLPVRAGSSPGGRTARMGGRGQSGTVCVARASRGAPAAAPHPNPCHPPTLCADLPLPLVQAARRAMLMASTGTRLWQQTSPSRAALHRAVPTWWAGGGWPQRAGRGRLDATVFGAGPPRLWSRRQRPPVAACAARSLAKLPHAPHLPPCMRLAPTSRPQVHAIDDVLIPKSAGDAVRALRAAAGKARGTRVWGAAGAAGCENWAGGGWGGVGASVMGNRGIRVAGSLGGRGGGEAVRGAWCSCSARGRNACLVAGLLPGVGLSNGSQQTHPVPTCLAPKPCCPQAPAAAASGRKLLL